MSPLALALAQRQQEPAPTVAPTDVLGAYKMSADQAMQKYQADIARSNAMWGGLAGLGGAGLLAFGPSMAPSIGRGISGLGSGLFGGLGGNGGAATGLPRVGPFA